MFLTDNFTHSLVALFVGIILIHYLKFKGNNKLPIIAVIIAGNLPDIDFIFRIFGAAFYFTNHRVLTHSVFGQIILALILALIFAYVVKQKQFFKYLLLSLAGIIVHVFLDIITSFGTVVLYPFSEARWAFSIIPIFDIFIISIFLVGLWFLKVQPEHRIKIAKATLFIFLVFLLFKTGLHFQAKEATIDLKDYDHVEVVPHFFNPFGWKAIVFESNSYLIADFDLTVGGFKEFSYYPIEDDLRIELSKKDLFVRQFLEFSKAPYPFINDNEIKWLDLRVTEGDFIGISAVVNFDGNNNIINSRFGI